MSSTVVLMSGGIDSTTLAHLALTLRRLHSVVCVDYKQPAARMERLTVAGWCRRNKVECHYQHLYIDGVHRNMSIGPGAPGLRIVPGRNMIMLAHAVNYAAANGVDRVWFGATADDQDYPDCRPDWIEAFNAMAEEGCGVSVEAPYLGHTKEEVVRAARSLKVDLEATWSCYEPEGAEPCGRCHSCEERLVALTHP